MAYVNPFDITKPAGTDPANVDDDLRALKAGINERFNDVFGFDFENDDPLEPTQIGPALTIQGAQIGTAIFNAGNSASTKNINWDDGDQQVLTLVGPCTLTFSNVIAGRNYVLYLLQGGTGGYPVTFPSSCRQSGGTNFGTPSLTTTVGRLSIVGLFSYTSTILVATVVATGVNVS